MPSAHLEESLRQAGRRISLRPAEIASHLTAGKLLRGRLVQHAANVSDRPDHAAALRYATAVELIHAGALVHDDIVDGSPLRRSRPSLWQEVGTRPALLTGIGLIMLGGAELAHAPPAVRRMAATLLRDVARGQTDELLHLFSLDVSPEAYLRRAQAKTGALYELAARLGAAAGNLPAEVTDAVAQFAATLGLAFQLADDVRDLVGGPGLGRPPGTDLLVGVYTLPVLLTAAGRCRDGRRLRALLAAGADAGTITDCLDLLRANGALDVVAKRARVLAHEANARLANVPSLRARVVLEAYACDLLGPLDVSHVAFGGVEAVRRTDARPSAPVDAVVEPFALLAAHPAISNRLACVAERVGDRGPFGRAIVLSAALGLLADEMPLDGGGSSACLVGAVDLLLAELLWNLAPLSCQVAHAVATHVAAVLFAGADRARGERTFRDDAAVLQMADAIMMTATSPC